MRLSTGRPGTVRADTSIQETAAQQLLRSPALTVPLPTTLGQAAWELHDRPWSRASSAYSGHCSAA